MESLPVDSRILQDLKNTDIENSLNYAKELGITHE